MSKQYSKQKAKWYKQGYEQGLFDMKLTLLILIEGMQQASKEVMSKAEIKKYPDQDYPISINNLKEIVKEEK